MNGDEYPQYLHNIEGYTLPPSGGQQQQQQQDSNFDYTTPVYNQNSNDASLVITTNPNKIMDRIKHIFHREEWDEQQSKWIRPKDDNGVFLKPMINYKGMNSLILDCENIVNQNTIMSNLSDEEISRIVIELGDTMIDKLEMEADNFEVQESDLNTILYSILNLAYISLKRGFMEGERRFLKTSVRSTEQVISRPPTSFEQPMQQQQRGIIGRFFK